MCQNNDDMSRVQRTCKALLRWISHDKPARLVVALKRNVLAHPMVPGRRVRCNRCGVCSVSLLTVMTH
jgi:hypothetical protein